MSFLTKNDHKRINFYLGLLDENIKLKDVKRKSGGSFHTFENIHDLYKKILTMNDDNHKKLYLLPLYKILIHYNICKNYIFFVQSGDVTHELKIPCFTKNIINERENNKGVILRCFNFNRHWHNYYNKPIDIPFEKKYNKIIWRGASTGCLDRKCNRFTLVEKWFNKNEHIDVGFSLICQNRNTFRCYLKNNMTIPDMLKYKYIISVEGNDKDSGINWKLNSNSLVLMPRPTVSSWLMETTLVPDHHYVLLKDDFSDLEEKFIWCENNQDKCKEIIKNANNYMKQFDNQQHEEFIERCVIEKYLKFYN